jgi:lipopolysaccharide/colanic/teichoic acid biosynthesis glycosyltransferase
MSARQRAMKRAIDVAVAGTMLVITLPLTLVVALAIVIESPGPVFYRAQRVGFRGRPLWMLKFRKMTPDARGLALTVSGDARLTRVGRLLVRLRLDELPQLWHILRGEMSLVGPRPESPEFVEARRADYDEILTVRPGIAGLSQLAFADEAAILHREDPVRHYLERILPQKCAIDRLYVREGSLGMDVRIVLWTLGAVFLRSPVSVNRRTGAMRRRRRPGQGLPRPEPEGPQERARRFGEPVKGASANGRAAGVEDAAAVPGVGARDTVGEVDARPEPGQPLGAGHVRAAPQRRAGGGRERADVEPLAHRRDDE